MLKNFYLLKSIKYMLIIILIWLLTLFIINYLMPQYVLWDKENKNIQNDMVLRQKYIMENNYPLLKYPLTKFTKQEKKVLIIGDSYIEGDGYNNINNTWWKQLQIKLYQKGYTNVTIYAIGFCGKSTLDYLNWLKETTLIDDIKPDLIIMTYIFNDPEIFNENYYGFKDNTNYIKNNKILNKLSKIYPNISYKINNMLNKKYTNKNKPELYDIIINQKNLKTYNDLAVEPLGEYINSLNIPFFLLTTLNNLKITANERYSKTLPLFKQANVKVYNSLNYIKGVCKLSQKNCDNNFKINLVNGHPGTFLTNGYADYALKVLENDYKDILGEREKIELPIRVNQMFPYNISLKLIEEKDDYVSYEFDNPNKNLLYMPIKKDYFKLNLEFPTNIDKIELSGKNLKKSYLYLNKISSFGYDTQEMFYKGKRKGNNVSWNINEKQITSINLSTKLLNKKEKLKIKIYKGSD